MGVRDSDQAVGDSDGPSTMPPLFVLMCQRIAKVTHQKHVSRKTRNEVVALVKGAKPKRTRK